MRWPGKVLIGFLTVITVWALAAFRLFVSPHQELPEQADAVVVLAGASGERLPVGIDVHESGVAPVLLISSPPGPGNPHAKAHCETHSLPAVRCFAPQESSTRGEARAIAQISKEQGWDSIIVVTSTYHLKRATTLVSQTTDAAVYGVASKPRLGPTGWARHIIHETVGLIDVLLRPEETT